MRNCWSGCSTPAGSAGWRAGSPTRAAPVRPSSGRAARSSAGSPHSSRRPPAGEGTSRTRRGSDWAFGVRDLVDARQVLAAQALEDAAGIRQQTTEHHRRWFSAAARHQRLTRLRELQRSVAMSDTDRQRWRAELEAARRAAPVAAAADSWSRARAALAEERTEVERRATLVVHRRTGRRSGSGHGGRHLAGRPGPGRERCRPGSCRPARRAGRRGRAAGRRRRRPRRAGQPHRQTTNCNSLRSSRNSAGYRPRSMSAPTASSDSRAAGATLDAATAEAAAAAAALRQVRRLATATSRHQDVVDDAQRAVDAAQDATTRRLELTAARIRGMAAELASGLVAGQECPVCGALDHPAPVAPGGVPVTAADLDRAERLEAEAITARRVAQDVRAAVERDVATLAALLAGRTVAEVAEIAAGADRLRLGRRGGGGRAARRAFGAAPARRPPGRPGPSAPRPRRGPGGGPSAVVAAGRGDRRPGRTARRSRRGPSVRRRPP